MKTLSIRQPWAWLISQGYKDIENRLWRTSFRGPLLIHAARTMTLESYLDACHTAEIASAFTGREIIIPDFDDLERGGIVGTCEMTDCVSRHPSPWFFGDYGFVLAKAKLLPFFPCPGKLGFFDVLGRVVPAA